MTRPTTCRLIEGYFDSLMARLDRLGSVKELAQVAAVIGRTFSPMTGCSRA